MKILAFSDWRIQSINLINEAIQTESPDIILYGGDDLHRVIPMDSYLYFKANNQFITLNPELITDKTKFKVNEKSKDELINIIQRFKKNSSRLNTLNIPFYYVNGNDDKMIEHNGDYYINLSSLLSSDFSFSLHNTVFEPSFVNNTANASAKFVDLTINLYCRLNIRPSFDLHKLNDHILLYGAKCGYGLTNKIYNVPKQYVDILLVHIPPFGSLDLSIRFGCTHIGSKKILNYIKQYQPKFVICGHSHFWGGKVDYINQTTIINISSNDSVGSPGNYALINIETGSYKLKQYKTLRQIRGAIFKTSMDIKKVYGSYKLIDHHNLLSLQNEEIIKKLEDGQKLHVANRVRSIGWRKPKIIKQLSFQPKHYTLIDIETGLPHKDSSGVGRWEVWLIGFLYREKVYQFEYPSQKKEITNFLFDRKIGVLVSWTTFDSMILKRIPIFEKMEWMDACQRVANCVIWHSYRLHELYDAFFNHTDAEIIDGAVAGIYADHIIDNKEICKYCPSERKVKLEIKERNKKDLLQMYELCELVWNYDEKRPVTKAIPNKGFSTK